MKLLAILLITSFAVLVESHPLFPLTSNKNSQQRHLNRRHNDKYKFWRDRQSSPITYISTLPSSFNNGLYNLFGLRSAQKRKEERSNKGQSIVNSIFGLYHNRPVKMKSFSSNGKPYNVFRLTTTSTTTTTTTTTTSTTSTTTPSTTAISRDHEEDAKIEQNGSITWLGKFLMNGLPKKLFNFKAPYYPLSWFNQLNDVNSVNSHVFTNLV